MRDQTIKLVLTSAAMIAALIACGKSHSGISRNYRSSVPFGESKDATKTETAAETSSASSVASTPKPPELTLTSIAPTVGIRSFAQINETMAVLTGVSPSTANVSSAFVTLSTQLPDGNDVSAFLASNQVAIAKLSAEYCDAMLENGTLRTKMFPTVNFTQTSSVALTPAARTQVIQTLIASFWGQGRNDLPDEAAVTSIASQLFTDILSDKPASTLLTKNAVKGVCSAVLSSAPVSLF